MAMVTYVGEEDSPGTIVFGGITFKKGEGLEILDYPTFEKAKANKAFKVEGEVKKPEHEAPGKPEGTPGKPGTGAPGQEKKPEVNPLTKK